MTDTRLNYEVSPEEAGERLDQFLQRKSSGLSRSQIKTHIENGYVLLNDAVPHKSGLKLHSGDQIQLDLPPPAPMKALPEDIPLVIEYEDDDILILNKAANMVVHPSPGHPGGTIVNAVLHHCGTLSSGGDPLRPGIVHRLDKDTTGLMVIAKNDAAHQQLSAQLLSRKMVRIYFAIVMGPRMEDAGTYETSYGRHPNDRIKFSSRVQKGKTATTHWRLLASGELSALVAIRLETGRTHQIRVHFTDYGHPVAGDPLYGTSLKAFNTSAHPREAHVLAKLPHQALHAGILGLRMPGTEELRFFSVQPPDHFIHTVETAFGAEAASWLRAPLGDEPLPGLDTLLPER